MPALTLYSLCIPSMTRSLENLSAILAKATTHASTANIPPSTLLTARLIADMDPLPRQIQRASDSAKGLAVRLCGHAPISLPDNETTFEELQARIATTLAILRAVAPDSTDGKEDQLIEIAAGRNVWELTGTEYVVKFALPNFFFHVVTAYAILRAQGVPVGKMDYLGDASEWVKKVPQGGE
jgi:hypothetical protein